MGLFLQQQVGIMTPDEATNFLKVLCQKELLRKMTGQPMTTDEKESDKEKFLPLMGVEYTPPFVFKWGDDS